MKKLIIVIAALFILCGCNSGKQKAYDEAIEMAEQNKYDEAISRLLELGNYKDSVEKITDFRLLKVEDYISKEQYSSITLFINKLCNYDEGKADLDTICNTLIERATDNYNIKEYRIAKEIIASIINSQYSDKGKYESLKNDVYYDYAAVELENGNYENAVELLKSTDGYKDSKDKLNEAMYQYVLSHQNSDDEKTYEYIKQLVKAEYKDSSALFNTIYSLKIKIMVNYDSGDMKTDLNSIKSGNGVPWVHFIITGRDPEKEYNLTTSWASYNGSIMLSSASGTHQLSKDEVSWAEGLLITYDSGRNTILKIQVSDDRGNIIASKDYTCEY